MFLMKTTSGRFWRKRDSGVNRVFALTGYLLKTRLRRYVDERVNTRSSVHRVCA